MSRRQNANRFCGHLGAKASITSWGCCAQVEPYLHVLLDGKGSAARCQAAQKLVLNATEHTWRRRDWRQGLPAQARAC